jgi:hypothetical protein
VLSNVAAHPDANATVPLVCHVTRVMSHSIGALCSEPPLGMSFVSCCGVRHPVLHQPLPPALPFLLSAPSTPLYLQTLHNSLALQTLHTVSPLPVSPSPLHTHTQVHHLCRGVLCGSCVCRRQHAGAQRKAGGSQRGNNHPCFPSLALFPSSAPATTQATNISIIPPSLTIC